MKRLALLALLLAPSVQAAIAFRSIGAVGTATGSGNLSPTAGTPAGVVATDVVVAVVSCGCTSTNTTGPAGWTRVAVLDEIGSGEGVAVFWALGSVASYVFNNTVVSDTISVIAAAYSGVDNVTPMDATPVSQSNLTASATVTAPSITTVTANTQLVFFGSPYDTTAANTGTWTAVFGTVRGSGGIRGGLSDTTDVAIADAAQAAIGASGAKTETYSAAEPNMGFLAALRPAGAAATTPARTLMGVGQ